MDRNIQAIEQNINEIVQEWIDSGHLHDGDIFVIGCSTSEVGGKHIGTSGSEEIASTIFTGMNALKEKSGVTLAFQCCEHLNRALVVERKILQTFNLEEVSVVPVPKAGGSMAAFAFKHMDDPVVVEHITAHAGIDIGETMIGMHLNHVAVPLRLKQRMIGEARVAAAYTRPKLIGGTRANYENTRLK
ncbi:TIGR01440 family protein [Oceanobacillus sp. Castelsardo]|uniref:TIGR01440 family protein n=1 Tax=Oceanobacillus sp. Castelsardo TaxID=1851204 RepID=UPI0008381F74|nr:TIGR01440 family protein [Oceanobacillus sp. Castelsardo]